MQLLQRPGDVCWQISMVAMMRTDRDIVDDDDYEQVDSAEKRREDDDDDTNGDDDANNDNHYEQEYGPNDGDHERI